MPGESARSLRTAAMAVAALGALSLAVPASLWLSPGGMFPVLHPVGQTVQARLLDSAGQALDSPAVLRPGSSAQVVVTGFSPGEKVVLRRSGSTATVPGGRADSQGVFRYRLVVPLSMSGVHSLTVIGSPAQSGAPAGSPGRTAVLRYVVSARQAGRR